MPPVHGLRIEPDDPGRDDVRALLTRHLDFAHEHSPPQDVHALDLDGLRVREVSFYSGRIEGELVVVGALKELDTSHGELKSMHTAVEVRGRGAGRAMVEHLLTEARRRGYRRVSLETGSTEPFVPARTLYERAGFVECGPFADYELSDFSTFMTLELG